MPRFSYDGARIAAGIAGGSVSVGHAADQMHVVASKASMRQASFPATTWQC